MTEEPELADAPAEWPVTASERVFDGVIVNVRHDTIRDPSGGSAMREVVEHGGAVVVVPVDSDGNVVVVSQYRHAARARLIEYPAGLLDVQDEQPLEAARRELAEEVGLAAQRWTLLLEALPSPGFSDERVLFYLAEELSAVDAPANFAREHEEADLRVLRVPLNQLVEAILDGRVHDGVTITGTLTASTMRQGDARRHTGQRRGGEDQ